MFGTKKKPTLLKKLEAKALLDEQDKHEAAIIAYAADAAGEGLD
jgi:hypothetical protein